MVRNKTQFEALVTEILKGFNEKHIRGTFLDPVAGTGQFVSMVEQQKKEAGLSDDEIHATTFGYFKSSIAMNNAIKKYKLVGSYEVLTETDFIAMFSVENVSSLQNYSIEFRKRLQHIKDDIIMKFDAIAGNPPFQETTKDGKRKDKASNLWSKFWSVAIKDLSKDDGVVGLITPTTWTSPSRDLVGIYTINKKNRLWDIFNDYTTYADVTNIKQHFPGVGSTFGYAIVDKSSTNGLIFADGSVASLGFLPKSDIETVKKHLSSTKNLDSLFTIDQSNRSVFRVSMPVSRVLTADSFEILYGDEKPTTGSTKDYGLYLYIYPNTMDEANQIIKRLTECIDIMKTHCRWSGFINIKAVRLISYDDPQ